MMIDTLAASESLASAGFDRDQAGAIARVVASSPVAGREDLVTKDHLDAKLAEVRAEIRTSAAELKAEMVRWLIGSQAALLIALVALANFAKLFA